MGVTPTLQIVKRLNTVVLKAICMPWFLFNSATKCSKMHKCKGLAITISQCKLVWLGLYFYLLPTRCLMLPPSALSPSPGPMPSSLPAKSILVPWSRWSYFKFTLRWRSGCITWLYSVSLSLSILTIASFAARRVVSSTLAANIDNYLAGKKSNSGTKIMGNFLNWCKVPELLLLPMASMVYYMMHCGKNPTLHKPRKGQKTMGYLPRMVCT